MFELPKSVEVSGTSYAIRNGGDYRMVLDCFNALNDSELDDSERIIACLCIFFEDMNCVEDVLSTFSECMEEALKAMFNFFACGQPEAEREAPKLIDWEKDEMLIVAGINNVIHTEVRALEYLHWWTFIGYYMSIGDSALSHVVSIRNKLIKGKKLEKWEKEFKAENPQYFIWDSRTQAQKELEDYVRDIWNSNSIIKS